MPVYKDPLEQSRALQKEHLKTKYHIFNELLTRVLEDNGLWRSTITHDDSDESVRFTPGVWDNKSGGVVYSDESTNKVKQLLDSKGAKYELEDWYGSPRFKVGYKDFFDKFGSEEDK